MNVLIRKAKTGDIEQIYSVLLEMIKSEDNSSKKVSKSLIILRTKKKEFVKSAKKELLREIKEKDATYLVAITDEKIVGYVRGTIIITKDKFFKTAKYGMLNALVVLKKYNGKGIASQLNKEIEGWFRKNKCSQIHLEVFEKNPAIKIYEKWGYKTFDRKMVKVIKNKFKS